MALSKRVNSPVPSPINVAASGQFTVNDGLWSTFSFGVGTSQQSFFGVVSMHGFQTWLPTPDGCGTAPSYVDGPTPADCARLRGIGFYAGAQSQGYVAKRSSTVTAQAAVGVSTLGLGSLQLSALASVFGSLFAVSGQLWEDNLQLRAFQTSSELILAVASLSIYLPTIGIGSGVTYIDGKPIQSPVLSLYNDRRIPSASWGFTAGASYNRSCLCPNLEVSLNSRVFQIIDLLASYLGVTIRTESMAALNSIK